MPRDRAQALLIDLDGVLRRWDPAPMIAVEVENGLKPAALLETAMSWDIYRPAMAGEITDAEWMKLVADRLPIDNAASAVAEWQAYRGEPSASVDTIGLPIASASNAVSGVPSISDGNTAMSSADASAWSEV